MLVADCKMHEALLKSADLEKMAEKTYKEGSSPLCGCTRCRYNRGSCINYRRRPGKSQIHFDKHPEMYIPGTKEFKKHVLKSLQNKDLIRGGGKVAQAFLQVVRSPGLHFHGFACVSFLFCNGSYTRVQSYFFPD